MRARLWLVLVSIFWIAMTALLLRSEFGSRRHLGASVPVEMVWRKMITAPDPSTMEIRQGTNRIGYCRWRPEVGQEFATGLLMEEDDPEGMVRQLVNYTLDFDGNLMLPDLPTRLRFAFALKLDTNSVWQSFDARISLRPDTYELTGNAADQLLRLRVDAGADKINRTIRFSELQNPQRLLLELGGPMLPTLLTTMGVPLTTNNLSAESLGLKWEARHDSLVVGGNRVRVYRVHARLIERFGLTLFVSPVGELLRAELPLNLVLVNDALSGLRSRSQEPDPDNLKE